MKNLIILGKPNVGKSTLFNRIVKNDLNFVGSKPGTTRRIIFRSLSSKSFIVDTPGMNYDNNLFLKEKQKIFNLLESCDFIILVININKIDFNDFFMIENCIKYNKKTLIFFNKISEIRKYTLPKILNKLIHTFNFKFLYYCLKQNFNKHIISNLSKFIPEILKFETIKKNRTLSLNELKDFIFLCFLNKLKFEIPYTLSIKILNKKLNLEIINLDVQIAFYKKSHKKLLIGYKGNKIRNIRLACKKNLSLFFPKLKSINFFFTYK